MDKNEIDQGDGNSNSAVQVVVRLRPPDPFDEVGETFSLPPDHPNVLTIKDPLSRGRSEHSFLFHKIFTPEHQQTHIFDSVAKPLVDRLLSGFNSCCFAYGQTGSGKTHSIFGQGNTGDRGLLPRCIEYLFEQIEQKADYKEIGMVVSFLEVYLDQIHDLGRPYSGRTKQPPPADRIRTGPGRIRPLSAQTRSTPTTVVEKRPWSASDKRPTSATSRLDDKSDDWEGMDLEIHEAPNGQVYVQNLSLIPVKNISEVLDVINSGLSMRATHETKLNPTSSRSHTVFTINLVQKDLQKELNAEPEVISGQINLVDLAGSERLAKSKSEGKRFHEAVLINASLSALGRVVLALASDPKSVKYIPYRDSKLTRILQSGLGGNSFTTLLCCINPSTEHYEESLNSLSFADRCKNVENRPQVNYVDPVHSSDRHRIRILLQEIAELKHQLDVSKSSPHRLQMSGHDDAPASLKQLSVAAAPSSEEGSKEFERLKSETKARLTEERDRVQKAKAKAQEAQELYQKARKELADKEQERRIEMRVLREQKTQLEDQVKKLETHHEHSLSEHQNHFTNKVQMVRQKTKNLLQNKDQLLLRIPDILKERENIGGQHLRQFEEKMGFMQATHTKEIETLKKSHEEQVQNVEKQYKYWLKQKEDQAQKFAQEIKEFTEKKNKEMKEYRTEITALYELVQQTARIISDMEMGMYPVSYKCGIKCVTLPPHARPKTVKDEDFPRLFQTLNDTKRKAEKYERLMQKYSPEPETPTGLGATQPSQPHHSAPAPGPLSDFDATRFAMEFCRSTEQEDNGVLRNLSLEQLRVLAGSLKGRCRGNFDIQAEKQKVREEVMQELSSHSTIEYLRHLEMEVERYKVMMQEEVHRSNNLQVALGTATLGKTGKT